MYTGNPLNCFSQHAFCKIEFGNRPHLSKECGVSVLRIGCCQQCISNAKSIHKKFKLFNKTHCYGNMGPLSNRGLRVVFISVYNGASVKHQKQTQISSWIYIIITIKRIAMGQRIFASKHMNLKNVEDYCCCLVFDFKSAVSQVKNQDGGKVLALILYT